MDPLARVAFEPVETELVAAAVPRPLSDSELLSFTVLGCRQLGSDGSKPNASTRPATANHLATTGRGHSVQEAMHTAAATLLRLIGSLGHESSFLSRQLLSLREARIRRMTNAHLYLQIIVGRLACVKPGSRA